VWSRPSLSPLERKRAPLAEVAAPLHRSAIGAMCTPLENPTGTLAPTQSGKTRRDLVHKAIDAPGALLSSTTKPDLLEFAALSRTRRFLAGPVLVYDATGTTTSPARLCWSPISGCDRPQVTHQLRHSSCRSSRSPGCRWSIFLGSSGTAVRRLCTGSSSSRCSMREPPRWTRSSRSMRASHSVGRSAP
jgi:hypothetical protein